MHNQQNYIQHNDTLYNEFYHNITLKHVKRSAEIKPLSVIMLSVTMLTATPGVIMFNVTVQTVMAPQNLKLGQKSFISLFETGPQTLKIH
jgi:hypothetical protein